MRAVSALGALLLAGLAACEPLGTPEEAVSNDPGLALHQAGDAGLGCDALDAAIARMNARITLAQRMTDVEVDGRRRLDAPATDSQMESGATGSLRQLPGLGTGGGSGNTVATNGATAASNETMAAQKGIAGAAILRANELIRLAKLRHCYAT